MSYIPSLVFLNAYNVLLTGKARASSAFPKLALKGDRYLETTLSTAIDPWGKTEIDFFHLY